MGARAERRRRNRGNCYRRSVGRSPGSPGQHSRRDSLAVINGNQTAGDAVFVFGMGSINPALKDRAGYLAPCRGLQTIRGICLDTLEENFGPPAGPQGLSTQRGGYPWTGTEQSHSEYKHPVKRCPAASHHPNHVIPRPPRAARDLWAPDVTSSTAPPSRCRYPLPRPPASDLPLLPCASAMTTAEATTRPGLFHVPTILSTMIRQHKSGG